jgi:hypothetical protein
MLYWSDDGDLMAIRYTRWKVIFEEQRAEGFNYNDWAAAHRMFVLVPAQAYVAKWLSSFQEFPPRQKPASFSIDEVMKKLEAGPRSK